METHTLDFIETANEIGYKKIPGFTGATATNKLIYPEKFFQTQTEDLLMERIDKSASKQWVAKNLFSLQQKKRKHLYFSEHFVNLWTRTQRSIWRHLDAATTNPGTPGLASSNSRKRGNSKKHPGSEQIPLY